MADNNFPESYLRFEVGWGIIQRVVDGESGLPMVGYERDIERKMQRPFATLSEKDRRRYAGIEAAKLGHAGMEYIAELFELDPKDGAARSGGTGADRRLGTEPGPKKKAGDGYAGRDRTPHPDAGG